MKKVNWETEEIVALISIYDRKENGEVFDLDTELQRLSNVLNQRADFLRIPHDETYRNLTGMKMMYQNLIFVASNNTNGLPNASKRMYVIYELYQKCPEAYRMILEDFSRRYSF